MARPGDWTESELREALIAYFKVLAWEKEGSPFSPTVFHRSLSRGPLKGRTEGSVARRMSNISAVLNAAGEPIVERYKPDFDHVGTNVSRTLLRLLAEARAVATEGTTDPETLDASAAILLTGRPMQAPTGSAVPGRRTTATVVYERSPEVVAWVLRRADGSCEGCAGAAPFTSTSGRPFLEVHHLLRLADGGPDVIENAVALCPNCHRRCHHSIDADAYRAAIIKRHGNLKDFSSAGSIPTSVAW